MPFLHRHPRLVLLASLLAATVIWIPSVHFLFRPALAEFFEPSGIPPKARQMAERHLRLWRDPTTRDRQLSSMRRSNSEWDFMGRTFLTLSLAEMCLRQPSLNPELLPVIDAILEETRRLEHQHGIHHFLMPYSKSRPYVVQPERSLFIDSEIALMLAARRIVEDQPVYQSELRRRVEVMEERLRKSPVLAAESYPDECWLFDHASALAAIRLADHLDGTDHTALFQAWLAQARQILRHPASGLLVSSYTTRGEPIDGPEGSSIWFAVHCLRLIDEPFAREQYELAREQLGQVRCGFGWSREWPDSWHGPQDIDSGAVIPGLGISAGGSGLAFIGAASFGDLEYLRELHTTLDFAACPTHEQGSLRYAASNQVGDSVMLYSMVLGPMWQAVMEAKR